jgi:hypothetical protein
MAKKERVEQFDDNKNEFFFRAKKTSIDDVIGVLTKIKEKHGNGGVELYNTMWTDSDRVGRAEFFSDKKAVILFGR